MSLSIKRGSMYFTDLDPAIGSEQGGIRPVLVIQNNMGNHFSPTVIIAAISGQAKKIKQPTHYLLPAENGLEAVSIVLLEQIRTIDKARIGEYIGQLDNKTMKGIDRCIAVSMGLEQ